MNVASLLSKVYRLTNTNSTTFLDGNPTNVLAELNIQYGHRILDILKVQVDRNANQEESTTDFIDTTGLVVGDLGYNGEYPFPTDLLKPIRVEVSYDGTTWKPCSFYDVYENDSSEHTESDLNSIFIQSAPYVRFDRDSFFMRPTNDTGSNITDGIHIWYEQRQTDLVADSPSFEANLHDILAYDLANQEYLMHTSKYTSDWRVGFSTERSKIEERFKEFYKNRFKRDMLIKVEYGSTNNDYS